MSEELVEPTMMRPSAQAMSLLTDTSAAVAALEGFQRRFLGLSFAASAPSEE